jgi:hypothetical protein
MLTSIGGLCCIVFINPSRVLLVSGDKRLVLFRPIEYDPLEEETKSSLRNVAF